MKPSYPIRQVLLLAMSLIPYCLLSQTFTEQTAVTIRGVGSGSGDWGDFDNDGDLDFILTGFDYAGSDLVASIYRNNGNNTFTELTGIGLEIVVTSAAAWGDYNNDGYLDLLIAGAFYSGTYSRVYRNNGNSTFTEQTSISLTGVIQGACAWADYDNDGDLDILLTGNSISGYISKIYQNNGNNTFTEQSNIKLPGVAYGSVSWGDYNNDGFPDILMTGITNSNQRISKIFRNNGDNSFTDMTNAYLAGVFYGSSAWGDYDNDGDLDIVITGALTSGNISVIYRNEGNDLFVQQSGITLTNVSTSAVRWGDSDNDGDLDLLIAGTNSGSERICRIFRNNGNNTFTERTDIALTGIELGSVAWGDYDSDNDLDILITGYTGSGYVSKIYRNSGLSANVRPVVPAGLTSAWENDKLVFRWNRSTDNNTPAAAINYNLRIGTTTGGSQVRSSHSLSGGKLLVANMNFQNNNYFSLKLPLKRYFWSVQAVDKNIAGSTFATEQITPSDSVQAKQLEASIRSNTSLVIRWTNGNGLRRVLFARQSSTSARANPTNGKIYKAEPYFGDGDQLGITGWFCMYDGKGDSVVVYGLGEGYTYDFQVVEYIDNAGLPLYFKTVGVGNPGVFSSSLYSEQTGIGLPATVIYKVKWGDLDNDGYLDIVNSGNPNDVPTAIYRNNGSVFVKQAGITFPTEHIAYDVADYDNDSDLDILLINADLILNEDFSIFRNNGNNTFTEQTATSLGVDVSSVCSGDYDNDGDLDILITGMISGAAIARLYRNNGNLTFTEKTGVGLTGVYDGSAAWGDFNNDGFDDIVLTGKISSTQAVTKIYKNNNGLSFTEMTGSYMPGVFLSAVAWGDYDNDGDLDLLLTGSAFSYYVARIYRNNGDDTFTWQSSGISLPPVNQSNVAWGDYNNDGYLDILITGYQTTGGAISRVYRNNGNSTLSLEYGVSLTGVTLTDCAWGDYDNDGDLDIMIGAKVYSNNTSMKAGSYPANTRPGAPTGLSSVSQPDGVLLSWAPVITDETNYNGLSYNIKIGTTSGGANIVPAQSDVTTGYRHTVALGNAQSGTSHIYKGLPSGRYYWCVQAVDQAFAGSAWSSVSAFEVRNVQAFFSADEVCLGLPTHFTDQSVVTDGIASWLWDFKDGTTSSLRNPEHTYTASGTYAVKLLITSTGNVKDSLEKSVIVKPRPVTSFTTLPTCMGTPTAFTNTTNNNGLSITAWQWDFGDNYSSTVQQPPAHGYLNAGEYPVELKATASNGCKDSVTKTVTVAEYPVAVITTDGPLSYCEGETVTLSVDNNSNYSYIWRIDGVGITGAVSNTYIPEYSGNFSVQVTNTSGNCSTTASSVTVAIKPVPGKPLIVSDNYQPGECLGETPVRLETSQVVEGYVYQWYRNGLPIAGATLTYLEGFLDQGDYSLEAEVDGCTAESDILNIYFEDAPDKPVIYAVGPTMWYLACSDNAASQYKWYYNGALIPGADKYYYVANQKLGEYIVCIANAKGCFTMSDAVSIPLTGIDEVDIFTGLNIYPNPTPGEFTIEMQNQVYGELNIEIFDVEGKMILRLKIEKSTEHFKSEVNMSGQAKGLYLINLRLDSYMTTRKLVIE